MSRIIFLLPALLLLLSPTELIGAESKLLTEDAVKIYEQNESCVYQIKVIDSASQHKIALGSGFQIRPDGLIVTNYHVISNVAFDNTLYTIRYIDKEGEEHDADLVGIDVVNDLALMKSSVHQAACNMNISGQDLRKGQRIFSMGNPHDLGMLIVEGTYNGFVEDSLYQKVLFSGSLNSGMSGGPAFDTEGNVVGVNVARSGDDLSFLVPGKYLNALAENFPKFPREEQGFSWKQVIDDQLVENQNHYMKRLIQEELKIDTLGEMSIPAQIGKNFKCWGTTHDVHHEEYDHDDVACAISDYIYISPTHYTGYMDISYRWFQSKTLNSLQLYNKYSKDYKRPRDTKNAYEKDVEDFDCDDSFIQANGIEWRAGLCTRQYKEYERLYDMHMALASLDHPLKGMRVFIWLEGVSQENGLALIEKIVESIKWTKSL